MVDIEKNFEIGLLEGDHYKDDTKLTYVIIVAFDAEKDKLILVKKYDVDTWEFPGGHIETDESAVDAAHRELYEETGAEEFSMNFISTYFVKDLKNNNKITYGKLFTANIYEYGDLPKESEIEEVLIFDFLPNEITYPEIMDFVMGVINK